MILISQLIPIKPLTMFHCREKSKLQLDFQKALTLPLQLSRFLRVHQRDNSPFPKYNPTTLLYYSPPISTSPRTPSGPAAHRL